MSALLRVPYIPVALFSTIGKSFHECTAIELSDSSTFLLISLVKTPTVVPLDISRFWSKSPDVFDVVYSI